MPSKLIQLFSNNYQSLFRIPGFMNIQILLINSKTRLLTKNSAINDMFTAQLIHI